MFPEREEVRNTQTDRERETERERQRERDVKLYIIFTQSTTTMELINDSNMMVEYIYDAHLDHPIGDSKYAKQIINKMTRRFSRMKTGIKGVWG